MIGTLASCSGMISDHGVMQLSMAPTTYDRQLAICTMQVQDLGGFEASGYRC